MKATKGNNKCPKCQLILMDDYWDTVDENKDGTFTLDVFEAWTCPNHCGYYIKKSE